MNKNIVQLIEKFTETSLWKKFRRNETLFNAYKKVLGGKVNRYVLSDRIDDVQNNGMNIIMEITHCLENCNVDFFVDNGTLLGIVRNNKLISWDYDVDFGIFITESFSWDDLETQMNKIGFTKDHQFRYKSIVTEQTYKRGEMYIDFFGHINDETTTSFYCFYKKEGMLYSMDNELSVMELKTVKITGTVKKELDNDDYVYIPIESEEYLAGIYGETWRIPNPNWISGSGPACIKLDGEYGYLENEGI